MSLEQHSIDQGYKASLADLEVTPPAHAWAAIAARLPNEKADEKGAWWWGSGAATTALAPEEKSKRERVVFWWWTGALIALATLSLLAYYGLGANNPSKLPTPNPNTSAASLLPIAETQSNTHSQALNLTSSETDDDYCPDVEGKKELATAKPIQSEGSSSRQLSPSTTIPAAALTKSIASTLEVRTTPTSSQQLRSVAQVASTLPASQATESSLPTDTKTTRGTSAVNPVGLSTASASINELTLSDLAIFQIKAPKLPFGPGIGCEDFKNRAAWSFAVRAFGGPGFVFQEYTSTDRTSSYQTLRDSIENQQLSVHGGLRFEAVSDVGLFLRAGIDYQMYRSNLDYLGPPRSRTIIDSVFMEDTQTWRVETRNEVFQEQRTVYNRQHALTFTGGVGFRKTFGNVSPYLMAEAGYEILVRKKGNFILPDGNFVDLAEDNQNLYINERPGFQFGGVIGVDFALTDRIEAGISAHYKQLGGLRGSADLLDFDQSTAFGALNLRYTIR